MDLAQTYVFLHIKYTWERSLIYLKLKNEWSLKHPCIIILVNYLLLKVNWIHKLRHLSIINKG